MKTVKHLVSLFYNNRFQLQNRLFCTNTISNESSIFNAKLNSAINKQIQAELEASFAYLSMSTYFGRSNVALPGCENYFMKMHKEEHEHALNFTRYLNIRGGKVILCPINTPEISDWTIKTAFQAALEMEKCVKDKLTEVINVSEEIQDITAVDIVTTEFLNDQDLSIDELTRILTQYSNMVDSGIGRYFFDKLIFKSYVDKKTPEKLKDLKNIY